MPEKKLDFNCLFVPETGGFIWAGDFSHDNKYLIIANFAFKKSYNLIKIFDMQNFKCLQTMKGWGHKGITGLVTLHDNNQFVIKSESHLQILNRIKHKVFFFIRTHIQDSYYFKSEGFSSCIRFSPLQGIVVAAEEGSHDILSWNINNREKSFTINNHYEISALGFSPDGSTLVSALKNGIIKFWDLKTKQSINKINCSVNSSTQFAFNSNGNLFAYLNNRQVICIDLKNNMEVMKNSTVGEKTSGSIAFSRSGKYIITGTGNFLGIYDIENNEHVQSEKAQVSNAILDFKISHDNKHLLVLKDSGNPELWSIDF